MLTPEEQQRLDQVVDVAEYQLKTMAESRALLKNVLEMIAAAGEKSPIRAEDLVGAGEDERVKNVMGLSALFRAEAACLVGDYWRANGFRKQFYGRTLVLVIYETTLTFRNLLGPQFRHTVTSRIGIDVDKKLLSAHRFVCKSFDQCRAQFGELRNGLLGHRSQDADRREILFSTFDGELAIARSAELFPVLTELSEILAVYSVRSCEALKEVESSIRSLR